MPLILSVVFKSIFILTWGILAAPRKLLKINHNSIIKRPNKKIKQDLQTHNKVERRLHQKNNFQKKLQKKDQHI